MGNVIKDYVKFKSMGLEGVEITPEDVEELEHLEKEKEIIDSYIKVNGLRRASLLIDCLSMESKIALFRWAVDIWGGVSFKNDLGRKCEIKKCFPNGTLICGFQNDWSIWKAINIDIFIKLYKKGDFYKVRLKSKSKFKTKDRLIDFELLFSQKITDELKYVDDKINEIKEKYNKLYREKNKEVTDKFNKATDDIEKIENEAPAHRYSKEYLDTAEVKEAAKKEKGVARVKDFWNTRLLPSEKARLLGWIASHIKNIRIYALKDGRSGKTLEKGLDSMSGVKTRETKYNDEGEIISHDNINGSIYFVNIEDAPLETLEKIVSQTGNRKGIFGTEGTSVEKRLADTYLAMFLVSEYASYGFVPGGTRNDRLQDTIDATALRNSFKTEKEKMAFDDGFLTI